MKPMRLVLILVGTLLVAAGCSRAQAPEEDGVVRSSLEAPSSSAGYDAGALSSSLSSPNDRGAAPFTDGGPQVSIEAGFQLSPIVETPAAMNLALRGDLGSSYIGPPLPDAGEDASLLPPCHAVGRSSRCEDAEQLIVCPRGRKPTGVCRSARAVPVDGFSLACCQ